MAIVTDQVAKIRAAVLGIEVRENIAKGIEDINTEVVSTTGKQAVLETVFNGLVINAGSENAEIVAARGSAASLPVRLSGVDAQLADYATSAVSSGVILNNQTKAVENTTILNQTLSTHNVRLSGVVYVSGTINIPTNRQVICEKGTEVWQLSNDHTFQLNYGSIVEGAEVHLPANYTKAAVAVIATTEGIYGAEARDMHIKFIDGNSGDGIYLESLVSTGYVTFCKFSSIKIYLGANAYRIKDTQHKIVGDVGRGWVNANEFTNIASWRTKRAVFIEGAPIGNKFINYDFQFSTSAPVSEEAIYCEGGQNIFIGNCWDWAYYPVYKFTSASYNNTIMENGAFAVHNMLSDAGRNNSIVGVNNLNYLSYWDSVAYDSRADYKYKDLKHPFLGNQDDCLAYAKERGATITSTSGSVISGGLPDLFWPSKEAYGGITYNDPSLINVVIEVDVSTVVATNKPLAGVALLGINFGGNFAENFKLEAFTSTWITVKDVVGNNHSNIVFQLGAVTYNKLRLTITKTFTHATLNPTSKVEIRRIYAHDVTRDGASYLKRGGGEVYGDITFGAVLKGNVVKTPDGTKKYRLGVDNTGAIISTLVP